MELDKDYGVGLGEPDTLHGAYHAYPWSDENLLSVEGNSALAKSSDANL